MNSKFQKLKETCEAYRKALSEVYNEYGHYIIAYQGATEWLLFWCFAQPILRISDYGNTYIGNTVLDLHFYDSFRKANEEDIPRFFAALELNSFGGKDRRKEIEEKIKKNIEAEEAIRKDLLTYRDES